MGWRDVTSGGGGEDRLAHLVIYTVFHSFGKNAVLGKQTGERVGGGGRKKNNISKRPLIGTVNFF